MSKAFVSLGSNINPQENIERAIRRLDAAVRIAGISTVYETDPFGRPGDPRFYNCIVELETDLEPLALKHQVLRRIEDELGRVRVGDAYAARTIDLDLILYDALVMQTPDIILPDPAILNRPFLALPLAELAPTLLLPGSGTPIGHIAACMPHDTMTPLVEYTGRIRKAILPDRLQ
ncbi:MAG TPA: 2-amino-4-hydroxy-6-hydroxymethyldihydropteridine diphosphokinase [Nitrospirota bacterium]|nr:2-amino-4-hydroxy-6-hydroxymethyldihydropteridine diphosphokinase [Nitrospirota bacterium]